MINELLRAFLDPGLAKLAGLTSSVQHASWVQQGAVEAAAPESSMSPEQAPQQPLNLLNVLPESVQQYWQLVDAYPILGALAVALLFLVAAFAIRFFIVGALTKVSSASHGFPGPVVIGHLRRPIFTTVAFFGLALAFSTSASIRFGDTLVNVCLSVIVASWMRAVFHFVGPLLLASNRENHKFRFVDSKTIPLLDLLVKVVVIMFGSYCLLMIWGINPVGWLASAGIVGIAVGFAAKDTLANVFSGFFILVDSPYKIGDYVNLDSGERGRVSHIGLRSTRILSRDDIEITLPNALIANAKIVNESGGPAPNIRITISVGVSYESDVDQVCAILQTIGDNHAEFCRDPAPRVRMRGFGASSLDFDLLGWIQKPEDRGRIKHEILMAIHKAFRKEGIEIPYTKTDVYIKSLPEQDPAS